MRTLGAVMDSQSSAFVLTWPLVMHHEAKSFGLAWLDGAPQADSSKVIHAMRRMDGKGGRVNRDMVSLVKLSVSS